MSDADTSEQFRKYLGELVDEEIDAATATAVAQQFPQYVASDPSTVPAKLESDLRTVAELLLAEHVEEVYRQTDDVGSTSRFRVIIGSEKPNTASIRSFVRGSKLDVLEAGVWEERLHVTFASRGDDR